MREYYRGRDAFVTDAHLVWLGPTTKIFSLGDLSDVELVEGEISIAAHRPLVITTGVLVALAAAGFALTGYSAGYALMITACAVAAFAFATRSHRTARVWALRGSYRGLPATLYSTTDARVFNQVTRALRRTLESRPPSGTGSGLATA